MKNRLQLPAAIRCRDFRISAGEVRAFRDGRMLALSWRADTKKAFVYAHDRELSQASKYPHVAR